MKNINVLNIIKDIDIVEKLLNEKIANMSSTVF